MQDVQALKAALMGICNTLNELPTEQVTQAWQQAVASFNALMTGTTNPNAPAVAQLLREFAKEAFYFEGKSMQVLDAMESLVASM